MSNPDPTARTLTFPELIEARRATDVIGRLLEEKLVDYLETLRPLLDPERHLGRFAGAKTPAPLADKALAQIQQAYPTFAANPVGLPRDFDPSWLTEIDNTILLQRWEYSHEARAGSESKTITMSHPCKWVLSYKSGCSLGQFARTIHTKEDRRADAVRRFVINALVLSIAVQRTAGFARLLKDLRYEVTVEEIPDLGKLPLVTVTSALPSFRPADELILAATAFSGVSAFNELIDMTAVESLDDPLKVAIQARVQGS